MSKKLLVMRYADDAGYWFNQHHLDSVSSRPLVPVPKTITDIFLCPMEASLQTAIAVLWAYGIRADIHPPKFGFGSRPEVDEWKNKGLCEANREHNSVYCALKEILGDDAFKLLGWRLRLAINAVFTAIPEEGRGLIYCPSPIAEMAAEIGGHTTPSTLCFGSCEGVELVGEEGRYLIAQLISL